MQTQRQTRSKAANHGHMPLLLLPNEITTLIFIECVRDIKAAHIAISISHVCQHWRSVALSLPSLWRSFWYTARSNVHAATSRATRLLGLYLERSQSELLDLGFDFREVSVDENRISLLETALPHVARWRHLTILASKSIRGHATYFLVSHLQTLSASQLQYLALSLNSANPIHLRGDLLPKLFKGGVPNLAFLRMDSNTWSNCLPPLSNITTLFLEEDERHAPFACFYWTKFVKILNLPTLSNLSLKGRSIFYPHPFSNIQSVVMEKLKHIRVDFPDPQPFLLSLKAPLLETLVLHNINFTNDNQSFWTFIQPAHVYSFPSLHSLVLHRCHFSVQGAAYLSQITSEVKDVIISHDHYIHSINILWLQLECVTLNLSNRGIGFYLAYMRRQGKKSLKCRIHHDYLETWKESWSIQLDSLHSICTIQEIPPGEYIKEAVWPPDSDGYFNARNGSHHFAISSACQDENSL